MIIENGQMILDSGPQVTTKTIEDTRQESEEYDKNGQQTHYTSNDDDDQINKNDDGNKYKFWWRFQKYSYISEWRSIDICWSI